MPIYRRLKLPLFWLVLSILLLGGLTVLMRIPSLSWQLSKAAVPTNSSSTCDWEKVNRCLLNQSIEGNKQIFPYMLSIKKSERGDAVSWIFTVIMIGRPDSDLGCEIQCEIKSENKTMYVDTAYPKAITSDKPLAWYRFLQRKKPSFYKLQYLIQNQEFEKATNANTALVLSNDFIGVVTTGFDVERIAALLLKNDKSAPPGVPVGALFYLDQFGRGK